MGVLLLGTLPLAMTPNPRAAGLTTSCHIHPPDELVARGERPSTIGPYASSGDCEAERLALFGTLGRCHCSQSFAPGSRVGKMSGVDRPEPPGFTGAPSPPLP